MIDTNTFSNLGMNKIKQIMKNAFSNLPKLETLQLFGNQLDNLNKNIMLDVPKNINIANIDIS